MRLPSLLSSTLFSLLLVVALAACAAPSASPEALGPALPEQSPSPEQSAPEPAAAPEAPPTRLQPTVPRAPSRGPSAAGAALDYSCSSDSDCTVKNVGNCCGYYPGCVNKDSPTDPEAVRAQCQEEGRVGVCGFPSINSCQCVQGRCEGSSQMLPSL